MEAKIVTRIDYLHCNSCGKQVSTGYLPLKTDTPDKGLIIRAWIECPECIEKRAKSDSVVFDLSDE